MSTQPEIQSSKFVYTPAPWKLAGREVLGRAFNNAWCLICKVSGGTPAHADNNARLIAAAPDLYMALKDLIAVIQTDDLLPPHLSYMRQATDAIAKAEGR